MKIKKHKQKISRHGKALIKYGINEKQVIDDETSRPSYGSMFEDGSSLEDIREAVFSGKFNENDLLKLVGTRGLKIITEGDGWRPYDSVKIPYMSNEKWKFALINNSQTRFHCFVRRSYTQSHYGIHYIHDYPIQDQVFWAKEKNSKSYGIFRISEIKDVRDTMNQCSDVVVQKIGSTKTLREAMADKRISKEMYSMPEKKPKEKKQK